MLQKFALAVKTKTVEFFAEEEEDEEEVEEGSSNISAVDEIITGQRVVVIKPDGPIRPTSALPTHNHHYKLRETLVSSLFTAISSFHASYLQLQSAHEPFNVEGIESADHAAVSHLRRLLELRKAYQDLPKGSNCDLPLTSESEAQVQENQSMLRMLEIVFNRLESDIDKKDEKVSALKQELREIEKFISSLEGRFDGFSTNRLVAGEKVFLSIGMFESVVKDSWKEVRTFTSMLVDQMKSSGWEMDVAAKSMYPNVNFAERRHCSYALLSYVCLEMFSGFGSDRFSIACDGDNEVETEQEFQSGNFLSKLIEHLTVDALEILGKIPSSTFAIFCKNKYQKIVHTNIESSLFGELNWWDPVERSWQPSNPLYKPFVAVCSKVWMLNKLALGFNLPVEIFQAGHGAKFSMVYMESIVQKVGSKNMICANDEYKIGFTVFPGFQVGSIIIQCKVYLNYSKISL